MGVDIHIFRLGGGGGGGGDLTLSPFLLAITSQVKIN